MRAFSCGLGIFLGCLGCSDDGDAGPATTSPGSDAATTPSPKEQLIAAFLKSACTRPIECGDPNAGQCKPYERAQLEAGLAGTTWTEAQIGQCTTAREALVNCMATADCPAVLQATACSMQKDSYLTSCDPLLKILHP